MTKGQRKKQKRMRRKLEQATMKIFSEKRMCRVKVCVMKAIKS